MSEIAEAISFTGRPYHSPQRPIVFEFEREFVTRPHQSMGDHVEYEAARLHRLNRHVRDSEEALRARS